MATIISALGINMSYVGCIKVLPFQKYYTYIARKTISTMRSLMHTMLHSHRYWIVLLLFAQITHNIVSAMATECPAAILSAACTALKLIIWLFRIRIYKNSLQDSLETLFLTNIVLSARCDR